MIVDILDNPYVYFVWQYPFIHQKTAPFVSNAKIPDTKDFKVVELGCGPGTNAFLFQNVDYFGFDINEKYLSMARRRFPEKSLFILMSQAIYG
jgi:ubiquinone/menaquinone biosynthesis C-methylase UbiE